MNTPKVLIPLNKILTVTSAARLRAVSKITKIYIDVKQYSFYKIYKKLDLSPESVANMLFHLDPLFIMIAHVFISVNEQSYYPINNHRYCDVIKQYIFKKYYFCFQYFEEIVYNEFTSLQEISDHCRMYTSNIFIYGTLFELCLDLVRTRLLDEFYIG